MCQLQETVSSCKCGNEDLIIWLEDPNLSPGKSLTNLEKIECPDCGRVVYGGSEQEIKKWNAQDYDDYPAWRGFLLYRSNRI